MNYFKLFFSSVSILRDFQNFEFNKQKINGKCIEFGASKNFEKNFLKQDKKLTICHYSNFKIKSNKIINIDLEKINNKFNIKYDNVVIFNVLEHLHNTEIPLNNINHILNKGGTIIGSTPFLYRIHGAPKDHFRFTKDNLLYNLKKSGFNKVKIKELGTGPFLASFSLLRSFLKYIPIVYEIYLLFSLIIDLFLKKMMKTNPKLIYPIGYFFTASKK
jgi:SAM-dependent methyltransferase